MESQVDKIGFPIFRCDILTIFRKDSFRNKIREFLGNIEWERLEQNLFVIKLIAYSLFVFTDSSDFWRYCASRIVVGSNWSVWIPK